jgi:CDP-4-dehydro-6-deoxyglucose reductase
MAGQNVTLGYAGGGADFRGDYPIASCPCDDRNLLFHVTRADVEAGDGFAARLFAGAVRAGDAIDVWGPYGDFVLKTDSGHALAFLCCDAGFAPVRSLVEHSLALDVFPAITVCWAATRPEGQYLANQCRAWADALDGFDYLPVEATNAAAAGRAGVERLGGLPGLAERDIYVAGSEAFVAAAIAELNSAGVPKERVAATVL